MQRILAVAFAMTLGLIGQQQAFAQQKGKNQGLPKVDYQVGQIKPLGQGLAVPVTNRGFVISPKTHMSVVIYNAKNRQILATKNLQVPAMHPNQLRRVIFVPPNPRQPILVRAMVDPSNRVAESNERNNNTTSRH